MSTLPINLRIQIINTSIRDLNKTIDPNKTIRQYDLLQRYIFEVTNEIQQITRNLNSEGNISGNIDTNPNGNSIDKICWLAENFVDKIINVESIDAILQKLQALMHQQPNNLIINKNMQDDLIDD